MEPDMMKRLTQLQQRAQLLGQLAGELTAAIPAGSEGYDATGYVVVALGADGLPAEIRIRDHWQYRLKAEQLGPAVLAAKDDAVQAATRAWTAKVDHSRWWRRQRDVDEEVSEGSVRAAGPPTIPPLGESRHSDTEFNEEILRTLQASRSRAGQHAEATAEGADDGRRIVVRLGRGGLTDCLIEPGWASTRDGKEITAVLSTALRRAKGRLAPFPALSRDLNALVGDALATFTSTVKRSAEGGDG